LTILMSLARLGGMKVIGLTGGIASGKSTVSHFLEGLGAVIIDADSLWHEALEADSELRQKIVVAFGKDILNPDGGVDRQKLGKVVFANSEALARLNNIMQPWMYQAVKARIEDYRRRGVRVVVLELPLLVEVPLSLGAGQPSLSDETDEVWVTVAKESTVLKRLKDKSGLSEAGSRARIRSQLPSTERLKHADVVIDTDCSLGELKARVEKLWHRLSLDT
jgi:dephospho-CoA kinase